MEDGLYTVKLVGDKHMYELRGSEQHTLKVLSTTLSDLTGYKAEYITERVLHDMRIHESRRVKVANNMVGIASDDYGVPHFLVKRVS
jgi:hypothetical protein